jgi:leader peptidase (prepilin peptidase)/N-methyltransferase
MDAGISEWIAIDSLNFARIFLIAAAPCVGSFVGLVVDRLPTGAPVLVGRSMCPACDRVLGARDLVPIASWLVLRGRCRTCGTAIGIAAPMVELAALGIAVWSLAVVPGWLALASAALGWTLLALALIDRRHLLLPDELTLPLIPVGLVVAWLIDPARLPDHLAGAGAGGLILFGLHHAYRRLRGRDGLGLGDVKLMTAAGAWVAWQGLPSVLLLGATTALIAGVADAARHARLTGSEAVPFGTHLAAAIWLVWLYGPLRFG